MSTPPSELPPTFPTIDIPKVEPPPGWKRKRVGRKAKPPESAEVTAAKVDGGPHESLKSKVIKPSVGFFARVMHDTAVQLMVLATLGVGSGLGSAVYVHFKYEMFGLKAKGKPAIGRPADSWNTQVHREQSQ